MNGVRRGLLVLGAMCWAAMAAAQTPPPVRRTANPHGALKVACGSCHTATSWKPIRPRPEFNHNTQTGWPLLGLHESVPCGSCHVNRVFRNVSRQCSSCHADFHRRQFGGNCQQCHTVKGWRVEVQQTREHANRFPLIGAHGAAPCESCHTGAATGIFSGLSTECFACHTRDYNQAQNPPHPTARIPVQCDQCHTMDTWAGARFDHAAITGFALEGAHSSIACAGCHVGGRYAGTPAQCINCHSNDFNGAQNPNHVQGGFPRDCSVCHSSAKWQGAVFDHAARTRFPLTGAHFQVQCGACHTGGRFAGTPQACEGCHLDAFNKTTNPAHAASNFPRDCAQCHTTTQWKGAKFDHTLSRFPLTGAHLQTECVRCHLDGLFTGTPQLCEGCHLANFTNAGNPNHVNAGFPKDCSQCHTTAQWKGAKFDHAARTQFPLTGAHAQVQCNACHTGGSYAGAPRTCDGCHLADFNKTTNPNHMTGGFPKDCTVCHTATQWKGAVFDHSTATRFPLTGAHNVSECTQCHRNNVFKGTPATCDGCHLAKYDSTTNPGHAAAGFSKDCGVCHTTTQWKGAKFDHANTRLPLTGAHVNIQCAQCHTGNRYAGTAATCDGCHLTKYNSAANPNHITAGFPKDCAVCHTTTQWQGAKFDHSASTRFPLTGAHVNTQCGQCHQNNLFKGAPATCEGCHLANYNSTTNPNHATAGFSKDCTICHTTTQWKGATFDHARTRFPLTGAHTSTQCAQCHINGRYAGTPQTCDGCHLASYNSASNPNHVTAGFPRECTACHTTTGWKGARFDHTAATRYPLTGAHTSIQCGQCHLNSVFKGTPATCDGCHLTNFNSVTNPNHVTAGFPKDCSICHTTTQWKGGKFDHTGATRFPLTGAHAATPCAQCHINSVFKGTPATCDGCHLANFNGATNPNHVTAGFPKDCTACHTTAQWKGARFDHTAATRFALTGAHAATQCAQCHINSVFKGTPATCDGCHLANFNGAANPNHVTAGFPRDCSICHTTAQWKGGKFDHTAATTFPLSGAHTTVQCALCHKNNVYKGTPATCDGCHLANYTNTTNPNHVTAGFPRDCSVCHSTTQWKGATFDHNKTRFALTGAHPRVACADCHVGGRYAGTPTDCYTCHRKAFETVSNPNHVTAGFPTTCTTCHTTTQWRGARVTHRFPIYTGSHAGKWTTCNDCHRTPTNYAVFSCIDCHAHNKTDMDREHRGRNNYVYASPSCYQCHPTGRS